MRRRRAPRRGGVRRVRAPARVRAEGLYILLVSLTPSPVFRTCSGGIAPVRAATAPPSGQGWRQHQCKGTGAALGPWWWPVTQTPSNRPVRNLVLGLVENGCPSWGYDEYSASETCWQAARFSRCMAMKKVDDYTVVVRPDDNGTFVAYEPAIEGCHAWGKTPDEARSELANVFEMITEEYAQAGQPLPPDAELTIARAS